MKKILFLVIFSITFQLSFSQSCEEVKQNFNSTSFSRPFVKTNKSLHSNYDQKFIHINIEANDSNRYIRCTTIYKLMSKESPIDSVYFEFSPTFTIDSVSINNQSCTYYYSNDTLILYTLNAIPANTLFDVCITYHGEATSGGTYRGLTNTYSSQYNQRITWTLSESFHLKDWLPCKQDLTDRLDSAWIFITVDSVCKAGSEGILSAITPLPNGKVRYEWKEHHPIQYYLLSIAVGKFAEYSFKIHIPGLADSLLIMNYIYQDPQCLIDNKADIERTGDFIRIFSEKYGMYPFADEKYGHCQVPLGGGMEHQTMTTLGSFVPYLVAHELSHMWFGDNITCATWQDIWINEGFASYSEYIMLQNYYDQASADVAMNHFHFRARIEPEGSIYIPIDLAWDENRIFNGNLSYKKGAALVHMIRYLCENDTIFFYGLKQLQNIYKDSVLTGADVRDLFETITGKDFHPLFDQYYYGKGYPIYNITWYQDSTQTGWSDLIIKIEQRGSSPDNNLFTIPLPFKFYVGQQENNIKLSPEQNIQLFTISTNGQKISNIQFDPQNWILDSLESFTISVNPISTNENYFHIYPIPAKDYIKIDASITNEAMLLRLYDINNKLVLSKEIHQFPYTLNIEPYIKNGVYFISLNSAKYNYNQKIVIAR